MADPLVHLRAALAGRYAIEREFGHGGMATVYLARDLKHARRVVLEATAEARLRLAGLES